MDEPSSQVLRFLLEVGKLVWGKELYHDGDRGGLWNKLNRRGLRPMPPRPGADLKLSSGGTLRFDVFAYLEPSKMIEFIVELRWKDDDQRWHIDTEIWVDNWPDEDGQTLVRSLPARDAATLDDCLTGLRAAVVDLSTCDDVLDDEAYSQYLRPRPSFSRGTLPSE